MRLRCLSVLLSALALTGVSQGPGSAASTATTAAKPSYSSQVQSLTNVERTRRGLKPLTASTCATGYAGRWAKHLAAVGALSHQPLRPVMTACRATMAGENVAYGNVTPAQLVAMWMRSPGHRANILNPRYNRIGVSNIRAASGRVYGVQVFLRA
jgi:uncharacterized protein YkwD